jgi:hypothetical protein
MGVGVKPDEDGFIKVEKRKSTRKPIQKIEIKIKIKIGPIVRAESKSIPTSLVSKSNEISRSEKTNFSRLPIHTGLVFSSSGVLKEFDELPESICEAVRSRRNLTLKQITSIVDYDGMRLNGLYGEMFNVIHDRIQLKVKRHHIKITHQGRVFSVSLYNWYDLKQIEKMIGEILFE